MNRIFTLLIAFIILPQLLCASEFNFAATSTLFNNSPLTKKDYKVVGDTIPDPTAFLAIMTSGDKDTLFKIWDKVYGGIGNDSPVDMIKSKDGNYFILASSSSGINGNKTSAGIDDYWLIKVDVNGNKIWEKTLGGNSTEIPMKIVSCENDKYIILGRSGSGIGKDKSDPSLGGWDIWAIKIDENGNKVWDKTIGTEINDDIFDAIALDDGSVIIVGNQMPLNFRDEDFQIIKVNSDGNVVWRKIYTGDAYDSPKQIVKSSNNSFIITGYSNSGVANNKSSESKGDYDYWVLKIDENGDKIWDKSFGGEQSDFGAKILRTSDNYYYLIGTSSSPVSGDKSSELYGREDIWVLKINEDGDKIWDKTFGGVDTEQIVQGIVLEDNSLVIGCQTISVKSGNISEDRYNNSYDIWTVKIDTNGNIIWDKRIGGGDQDYISRFFLINPDELFILASSWSGIGFDKTAPSWNPYCGFNCTSDVWLLKYKLKNKLFSPVNINPSQSINLVAINCTGSVSWSTGASGYSINVSPVQTTSYTATCNTNGSSITSAIVVVVNNCGYIVDLTITTPITTGTSANPITSMAQNKITATNTIGGSPSNASARYVAGKSILLSPGFKVQPGSTFQTKVSPGCN